MQRTLLDRDLRSFGRCGRIRPFRDELVNPASYNLRIGTTAKIETAQGIEDLDLASYSRESPYWLEPGGWILTDVIEWVDIPPDHEACVVLRSSAARMGWDHALAGYIDPGYSGRLTLEFVNCLKHHCLPLYSGAQLVQIRITSLGQKPCSSYEVTGRYSNAVRVESCKDPELMIPMA